MREYGKVYSTFWSSATTGALGDDAKMLALYLLTCQHATIAGVFRLPDGYMAEDLGWGHERVAAAFNELSAGRFAERCHKTKWVWVRKHLEWNRPENPNQRKAAGKMAQTVPVECLWRAEFMAECGRLLGVHVTVSEPLPNGSDNGSQTLQQPLLNQEQEQEQEQKQEPDPVDLNHGFVASKSPRPSRKAPASFLVTADLQQWAREHTPGLDIRSETEKLRDHTFKTAITDWPGAWRNWMRRAAAGPPGQATPRQQRIPALDADHTF